MSPEVPHPEHERQPENFTLEDVTQLAKEIALESGVHVPTLIVEGSGPSVIAQLPDMPDTHEGRLQLMHAAGFALGASSEVGELEQVFFISEAWVSVMRKGRPPVLPPSADPERKEVLIISNLKVEGHQTDMAIFEMVREDEQLVALEPYEADHEAQAHTVEMPLLDAFVAGFSKGASGRQN